MIFRESVRADLPAVIALPADGVLGRARDVTEVDDTDVRAFADITADPRNHPAGRPPPLLASVT